MLILKQSNFAIELNNFEKGTKTLEKNYFSNNLRLLFSARETVIDIFKSRLFPIKNLDEIQTREPTSEPATKTEVAKEPVTQPEVAKEPATEPEAAKKPIKAKRAKTNTKDLFKIA